MSTENIITSDILANRTNKDRNQDDFYVSFFGMNQNTGNYLGRQVKSVSRPRIQVEQIFHSRKSARYNDTGKVLFDPVQVVFSEDEDAITSMLIYAQIMRQKASYKGQYDHLFGPQESAYGKFGMKVGLYSSLGEETESFILSDCFIETVQHSENIMSGDRMNDVTIQVIYDNIELKIFDKFVSLIG